MAAEQDQSTGAQPGELASSGAEPFVLCIVDQIGGLSNGAAIRQHHLVRVVATLGNATVLVLDPAARGHEAELEDALGAQIIVSEVGPLSKPKAIRRMLRHPFMPWRLARSNTRRLSELIATAIEDHDEPVLLWVSSFSGWMALSEERRSRTVFDFIDRPGVFHAQQVNTAVRRLRRALVQRHRHAQLGVRLSSWTSMIKSLDGWIRGDILERAVTSSCRLVVSCNRDEQRRVVPPNHRTVPNCFSASDRPAVSTHGPLRLLFPAGFKYLPNLDGAEWFLLDVLPELRRTVGPVEVVFAGSYPKGFEQQVWDAGALATGWVPDMSELYVPGTVLIVPLLGGSGTRVKILEAWSLGVPVISTPRGAAGLGGRDGVELLLARTPAEWASACLRLMSPGVAEELSIGGRRRFEQFFSSDVVGTQLQHLLRHHFDELCDPAMRAQVVEGRVHAIWASPAGADT